MGFEEDEQYESPLQNPPKKKSTKLITGIATLASLVVGGLIGWLITSSMSKCDTVAPPPEPQCPICPVDTNSIEDPDTLIWGSTAGDLTKSLTPRTGFTPYTNYFTGVKGSGVTIESDFDSGNVVVLSAADPSNIELAILPDPFSERDNKTFLARFLYKVVSAKGVSLKMSIMNTGDVNVASDNDTVRWGTYDPYKAQVSYDGKNWVYLDTTSFDVKTGVLTLTDTPTSNVVWYAYYPPYPISNLEAATARWGDSPLVTTQVIGQSVLGQALYLVIVGEDTCEDKVKMWVTAGQHPSETQGMYFAEGLVDAALAAYASDPEMNATYATFFENACLFVAPHVNPDGTFIGHHRTNALGHNLNRVWDIATPTETPEVYYVEEAMKHYGVDLYLDAHADEDYMGHFIFFAEGVCAWDGNFTIVRNELDANLKAVNPEYAGLIPAGADGAYEPDPHCEAPLKFSDNWTGDQFGVVAGTLEMPFKDVAGFENNTTGFSPARAYEFGTQAFTAFAMTVPAVMEFRGYKI